MPVYCTEQRNFRIDGRAIPARLVIDPLAAGLAGAEVHWVSLTPDPGPRVWGRKRIPRADNRWALEVTNFDPPSAPGIQDDSGTVRFAAAIQPPGSTPGALLETDGWSKRPGWERPEEAPGFLVVRPHGMSLSGYVRGFARLPIRPDATLASARNRVSLRPIDVIVGAYEDFADVRLDGSREQPLDSPEWSWLFDVIVAKGFRRSDANAQVVGARGRGVPWSRPGPLDSTTVRREDVLLLDDDVAVLLSDDGDGWLGNQDLVLHTGSGQVAEGRLGDVPGKTIRVVRMHYFHTLRIDLKEAGYGDLGQNFVYGQDLRRAIREFEKDHGLPVDGIPDPRFHEELAAFLARIREPGEGAAHAGAGDGP
jgi:Putative peptidoglycan binding domain